MALDITRTLRLLNPNAAELPHTFRQKFDQSGVLKPGNDPLKIFAHAGEIAIPAFRVSIEVSPFLEELSNKRESIQLRRDYEQRVQSSEYPAHETKLPLFPYQREGMLHLAFTERAMVGDEMGLGKTLQTIAFLLFVKEEQESQLRDLLLTIASPSLFALRMDCLVFGVHSLQ